MPGTLANYTVAITRCKHGLVFSRTASLTLNFSPTGEPKEMFLGLVANFPSAESWRLQAKLLRGDSRQSFFGQCLEFLRIVKR